MHGKYEENMRKISGKYEENVHLSILHGIAWKIYEDLSGFIMIYQFTMIYRWIGSRKAETPLAAAIQGVACKACRTSASTSDIKQGKQGSIGSAFSTCRDLIFCCP